MKFIEKNFFTRSLLSSAGAAPAFLFFSLLLLLLLLLFAFSMYHRTLHIDEAILGEQVYWLLKEGTVKSLLYAGIGTGLENKLLVYHKLFIWLGAGIASLFGVSLNPLRFLSLFFAILLCYSLYRYNKDHLKVGQSESRQLFLLLLVFLLSNSLFFAFSFIFRPEMMQAYLGFVSFYLLAAYFKRERIFYILLAAVFAGFAALTHLNGLIFISAGFFLLVVKKEYKNALLFGALAMLTSMVYFADMLSPGEAEQFITQFSGAPAFEESDLHPLNRFMRVLDEYKRYFHSQVEGSFTILLILIVAVRFRYLWERHALLLLYTLFAGGTLAIINQGQTSKYALLLVPFAALLMADGMRSILVHKPRLRMWFVAAFAIYLGIQFDATYNLLEKRIDLVSRNETISKHIPMGSRVYAPASFFFNQIENYELRSIQTYYTLVHRFHRLGLNKQDFFNHTRSMDSDYVILDLLYLDSRSRKGIIGEHPFREGETYYGYQVIQAKDDYIILRRLGQ